MHISHHNVVGGVYGEECECSREHLDWLVIIIIIVVGGVVPVLSNTPNRCVHQ